MLSMFQMRALMNSRGSQPGLARILLMMSDPGAPSSWTTPLNDATARAELIGTPGRQASAASPGAASSPEQSEVAAETVDIAAKEQHSEPEDSAGGKNNGDSAEDSHSSRVRRLGYRC